jgi:hypothetical protein
MAATVAYGQGNIIFGNYYSSTQTTGVTYGNGPAAGLGVGPEGSATLFWGASTDTLVLQLSPVAGSTTPFGLGAATGPGAVGGGTGAGLFVHNGALSINGGVAGNYAFAIEATGTLDGITYIGNSPVVVGATQATAASPVPNLPNSLYEGSFTVTNIPEPSILALSSIGAAALILVRRKK